MKLRAIFWFTVGHQLRRVATWVLAVVLVALAFMMVRSNYLADARSGDFLVNSPFVIAATTVMCGLVWVLAAGGIAGDAAARDVQTRMHPLSYTAPVTKLEYLGGRYLGAFVVNALLLAVVQLGVLLAVVLPGVEPEVLGPFRVGSYASAYAIVALPSALVVSALQFSFAALSGRAAASYLASVLLFMTGYVLAGGLVAAFDMQLLGKLIDPIGGVVVLSDMANGWTTVEKNSRLISLDGALLANRILWVGVALATLAFTYGRFRLGHPFMSRSPRGQRGHGAASASEPRADTAVGSGRIGVADARGTFGFRLHVRQALAIARRSYQSLAKGRSGLLLLAPIAIVAGLYVLGHMEFSGVPLLPRTDHVLLYFTAPLTDSRSAWMIIPLLSVLYAGEVVWSERDAGLSDIPDAAPVPEWVTCLGKFLGVALMLATWVAILTVVGILVQMILGYGDFEIGLYLRVLFGLQLADYLLFAMLALVLHVLAGDKHLGYLLGLLAYACIAFAPLLGVEHRLLVYGAGPPWSYTDMRGFGPSLGPWLWFKLYWGAWALLLGVAASLLWRRGRDTGLRRRLDLARRRLTPATAWSAAGATGLVLLLGGFIFYNTNVLHEYRTRSDRITANAEYLQRYGGVGDVPQPRMVATRLEVDLHPGRGEVGIRGGYVLRNDYAVPIDSVHLAVGTGVETEDVRFEPPAREVGNDAVFARRTYVLDSPLRPGDTLRVSFEVHVDPRGFASDGVDASVSPRATHFTNADWLPIVGAPPSPFGVGGESRAGAALIEFDAVVATDPGQVVVAPGELVRSWTEGGRRHFHYASDVAIPNEYGIFSATYEVQEQQWNDVEIQVFRDPAHQLDLDRIFRSVRAALEYGTRHFGPYPYPQIRLIERPGHGFGLHAEAMNISYGESFSLMNPAEDARPPDVVFAAVAHETAHQWWGTQLPYARAPGAVLLTEGLATYSAMRIVEEVLGGQHLDAYRSFLRRTYPSPEPTTGRPLLRAEGSFDGYRRGPFALYALSEYIGVDRMDMALRELLEEHRSAEPPLPTSLDLYEALQAATPDSLRGLAKDLFEASTLWEFAAEEAGAEQLPDGRWRVTVDVRSRKLIVDEAGTETAVPLDDWVEIEVLASADGGDSGDVRLYRGLQHLEAAEQTISVIVPRQPARVGVDVRRLLSDPERSPRNVAVVGVGG